MYNYTFTTVLNLTRFHPCTVLTPSVRAPPRKIKQRRCRAHPHKRKQPPSWTTAFLFRRYANEW